MKYIVQDAKRWIQMNKKRIEVTYKCLDCMKKNTYRGKKFSSIVYKCKICKSKNLWIDREEYR